MNHITTNNEFGDHTLRLNKIIYIATAMVDYELPEDLEQVLSDETIDVLAKLFGIDESVFGPEPNTEYVTQILIDYRKFGFLVQAATPVRKYVTEHSWRGGWGGYYTKWLYAETLEEVMAMAMEWGKERHASDFAKFQAAGGAK